MPPFRHLFAITGVRRNLARMHEAIGIKHRGEDITRVAQMNDQIGLIDCLGGRKETNWPEAAVFLRDEVIAAKNPIERERRLDVVRRIVANSIYFTDVLQDAMQHHRPGLVGRVSDDVAGWVAKFAKHGKRVGPD